MTGASWKESDDILPPWLGNNPIVDVVRLELNPPSLNDNRGDLDRMLTALEGRGGAPVEIPPGRLNRFARAVRSSGFKVSAVLGYARCHYKLIDVLPYEPSPPSLAFAVDLGTT